MADTDRFRAALGEGNRPAAAPVEAAPASYQDKYPFPFNETIPRTWGSFEAFEKAMVVEGGHLDALETLRQGRAKGLRPIQPGHSVGSLSYEDWSLSYAMHEAERHLRRRHT
jgi:hypothetical protein